MYFSFTSTSYDRAVAEKYIHGDTPYKVMIHIENPQHGALIGNNSAKPSDREVLFPENIRFRPLVNDKNEVIFSEDKNKVRHVNLIEVAHGRKK